MSHITGGGIPENLPRCMSSDFIPYIDKKSWKIPVLFEFRVLRFSRFLLVSEASDLSRKVLKAISCNLAPVRSKFDRMGPSYDDVCDLYMFCFPYSSILVEGICYFWLQIRILHVKILPGVTSRGLETWNVPQLWKLKFAKTWKLFS